MISLRRQNEIWFRTELKFLSFGEAGIAAKYKFFMFC